MGKKKNKYVNGVNQTYVNKMMNRVGSKVKREQINYIMFNPDIPFEMKISFLNNLPEKEKKKVMKRMKLRMMKDMFF